VEITSGVATFAPRGEANRAEAATILKRFIETFEDSYALKDLS
jgi:hypothetical protein